MINPRGNRVAFLTAYGIIKGDLKEKTETYVILDNANVRHGDCKPVSFKRLVLQMFQVIGWEQESPEAQKQVGGLVTIS